MLKILTRFQQGGQMTALAWDSKERKKLEVGGYHRERSDNLYHTFRWTRLSRAFRQSHPLCAECARNGRLKAAEVVDHVVPFPVCRDFFDESNLQSLCSDCNIAKGNRDKAVIAEWRRTHANALTGAVADASGAPCAFGRRGEGASNLSADPRQDHDPSFGDASAENRPSNCNVQKLK